LGFLLGRHVLTIACHMEPVCVANSFARMRIKKRALPTKISPLIKKGFSVAKVWCIINP